MIIYKDIVTDDELLSDAYPVKEVDGMLYEADCAMVTISDGDIDIGANPSAEGGDDDVEEGAQTVNNIVNSFRLQPTAFDKKSYMSYIKGYMKTVKNYLSEKQPDQVQEFEAKAAVHVKNIIKNFNDYEFYVGESMDPDGMVVLLNYREDGVTPYVTIWKHGVTEMKI